MDISLVASSIRPRFWEDIWLSLKGNKCKWELIFVGNIHPNWTLHKEIRFIYSVVKPAQCYEIGFRASKGKYIHWTTDEAIYNYERDDNLDILLDYCRSLKDYRKIIGFKVMEHNGESFSLTSNGHTLKGINTPQMACFGVISACFMKELGGYDRNFITGQAENDLCMRAIQARGAIHICENATVAVYHNKAHQGDNTLFRKWYPKNREYLEKCWFKDGILSNVRLLPFEPFDNKCLIMSSQGPEGDW